MMGKKSAYRKITVGLAVPLLAAWLLSLTADSLAAPSSVPTGGTMRSYCIVPPFIGGTAPPLVMLLMEKDHKLFFRAYDDFSDLDGDGQYEYTYKHSIDYYGYFDSYKCYRYSAAGERFNPVAVTPNKYCNTLALDDTWSGNFLNWATMTRMDVIRKALYGGKREDDSATVPPYTVLKRTFLPQDGHSFVKTYNGYDLAALTPYRYHPKSNNAIRQLSICNTTKDGEGNLPMMRVAAGDDNINIRWNNVPGWERWASNDRWQCAIRGEHAAEGDEALRPGNDMATYGNDDHLEDLYVQVAACQPGLIGRERCKLYEQHMDYKPIGLLQEYGEDTSMYFGLMTGSYTRNKSGGVLRQKLADVGDLNSGEINRTTGVFTGIGGIIPTIDGMNIKRYSYVTGNYDSDNCPDGRSWFLEGQCTNWGNPLAEMYYEALRVFAGKRGATSAYFTNDGLKYESWNNTSANDPYTYSAECAEAFALILSDSYPSYDGDQLPGSSFGSFTGDLAGLDVSALATSITDNEGISGYYFIGNVQGGIQNNYCSSKPVSDIGRVRGLCPTEGGAEGTYYLPSVAMYGQTTDLRPDTDPDTAIARTGNQNVTAYSVALGDFAPYLDVDVNGKTVRILPSCFNNSLGRPCGLVKFSRAWSKSYPTVTPPVHYDVYYAVWDAPQQGGDYDSDVDQQIWIKRKLDDPDFFEIWSAVVKISTSNQMDVGYVVSGTTEDGPYLPARVNLAGTYGCINADQDWTGDLYCLSQRKYTVTGSPTGLLKSPLWYASKYGGFRDMDGNGVPNLDNEWDSDGNGVPDTYFLVTNPLQMEAKLVEAFSSILNRVTSGTAASVLASGEGSGANLVQAIYYPRRRFFNSEIDWTGGLHAYWYYVDPFFENSSIREDTVADHVLDLTQDDIVLMYFDQDALKTRAKITPDTDGDGVADGTGRE